MAAPKGNRFWEARSSHGRKPIFPDPETLRAACLEYFAWCEDNPLWETKVAFYQGVPSETQVPKLRAMTLDGLCNFLDIGTSTWHDYSTRDDFSEVVAQVESCIRQQKFAGAAADLLNANIIARDLGLADKRELDAKVGVRGMTEDQIDAALARYLSEDSDAAAG